jgi:2'-5' RNA ligase
MRLFFAIVPPPRIQQLLDSVRSVVEGLPQAGLSWTPLQNLHLTIKFLGEVEDGVVSELCSAVSGAPQPGVFPLIPVGLITLPPHGPMRVLAAALEGKGQSAMQLAAVVDQACNELGFRCENHAFKPHITLARSRSRSLRLNPEVLSSPAVRSHFAGAEFLAEELILYSSDLSGPRPRYVTIATFVLPKA